MSRWTCDVCKATGQQPTVKAARAELAHHYLKNHNETEW